MAVVAEIVGDRTADAAYIDDAAVVVVVPVVERVLVAPLVFDADGGIFAYPPPALELQYYQRIRQLFVRRVAGRLRPVRAPVCGKHFSTFYGGCGCKWVLEWLSG